MKNTIHSRAGHCLAAMAAVVMLAGTSCTKNDNPSPGIPSSTKYDEVKLVSDQASDSAAQTDPNLKNPWGIAIGGTGAFWLSANGTGTSTIYDRTGATLLAAVQIPALGALTGNPTGVVFNSTSDFKIGLTGETSKFIFATTQGTIAAWSSSATAITVANRSTVGAAYTGLAIAADSGANYIYAADFKNARIDVYDKNFAQVEGKAFVDSTLPAGYAPFNIRAINGKLYVLYAKQNTSETGEENGTGNGYINVFNANGTLASRFTSQGSLNSPWGIAVAPAGFGVTEGTILVANFGDGHINAFDTKGVLLGSLKDAGGNNITIDGLWDITFPVNGQPAGDANQLFFSAGTANEAHGLFGYLKLHAN